MKKTYKILILTISICFSLNLSGQKLSGTYIIPGGMYKSLTCDAEGEDGSPGIFEAINTNGLSGNVNIIIDGDILNESGFNELKQWTESGAGGYSITIKPDGTKERVIETNGMFDMITLDGAKKVIIDGQYNNDSKKHLRLRNRNGYNSDITFINGASNNSIKNCYLETNAAFPYTAAIVFSTSEGEAGNNFNTISYCDIKEISDTTYTPYYGIYSDGSSSPNENRNNTISNCNIYNFENAGIYIAANGNGGNWTITGNSFYNNLKTPSSSEQKGIDFEAGDNSDNNVISGNFIGGSSAACGGDYWVNNGDISFYGIYANANTGTKISIHNNTIQNINLTGSQSAFNGIFSEGGCLVDITDNIIGHSSVKNSIISGAGNMYGIYNAYASGSGTYNINNNLISNISSLSENNFTGIENLSGSPTTTVNIKSNKINNLSGSISGIFNVFRGIDAGDSSIYNISGNEIHDLTTESVNGWNWGWGLTGIVLNSTSPGQTIYHNKIYNLINSNTTEESLNVYGIVYSGPNKNSPVSTISSNHIYNLTASTSVSSGIFGIYIVSDNMGYGSFMGGCGDIVNNMISLGNGMNGYSHNICGIFKSGSYSNNCYYNSVYIGNKPIDGNANTACYINASNTNDIIKNNIFYNAGSNEGNSTAIHNAIVCADITGLMLDHNDYIVTGNGGFLSDLCDTIPLIAGQDANSLKAIPIFKSITDLHLTSDAANNKIFGKGLDLSGNTPPYIIDFDNEPRTSHPDIGADQYYKTTGINSMAQNKNDCKIYSVNKYLNISYNNSTNEHCILRIFNVEGQQMMNDKLLINGDYNFELNLDPGCYIVSITGSKKIYNKKIIIN